MNKLVILIIAFLVTPALSGCLEAEDKRTIIEEPGIFDFNRAIPETTWYHYSGGINALDDVAVEQGVITPRGIETSNERHRATLELPDFPKWRVQLEF